MIMAWSYSFASGLIYAVSALNNNRSEASTLYFEYQTRLEWPKWSTGG
jgi:hypothetical protein